MSWLRRLSRDRSSKGEQDYREMPPSFRPSSSYANNPHNVAFKDTQYPSTHTSQDMLQSYRRADPQEQNYAPPQRQLTSSDGTMHTAPSNLASAPDPLTRAFNEAIKPYVEQIDMLKTQIDDLSIQNQQLEGERTEMHAWIDKRGLRPGKSCLLSNYQTGQGLTKPLFQIYPEVLRPHSLRIAQRPPTFLTNSIVR